MNGKYLERFGKKWGTKAKHATAHGGGVRCPATTISCIKILPSWPNEAKNSCVLRQLISVHYEGGSTKRRSIYRACCPDLSRMLNGAAERGSWVGTASDFPFIH
jgi:hypothetical protein